MQSLHEGNKFKKLKEPVILVSHNLSSIVDLCDRAILLDEGKIVCGWLPQRNYIYIQATVGGKVIFKIFQSSVR